MRGCGYKPSHLVADTGRMPTPHIWADIPWDQILLGQREGWVFFDDFINMPNLSADADLHKYAAYIDTSCTIQQGAGSEYGELEMTLTGADNDEASLQTGGQTGGLANFMRKASGAPHTIAMEFRWKVSTVVGSVFLGFAEEGCAASSGLLSDTGTIPDKDCFGFFLPEATPTVLELAYNKSGGADHTTGIATADTIAADTYVKSGFVYDYKNSDAKQIKCYADGVLNSSFITKTNIDDTTNFPSGEEMGIYMCVKNVTDIKVLTLDWVKAALVVNG